MAKQIKPEGETADMTETAANTETVAAPANIQKDAAQKPEPYVLSLLQAFPAYEQLYIDKQGGIYTPDTPENIRGMATLYRNPYFTKP